MSAPVERRDVHGRMLARELGKISALLPVTRRGLVHPIQQVAPGQILTTTFTIMDTDTAAATPPRWAYGPRLRRLTALIDSACHQSLRLPTSANIMPIFSRRRVLYGYRPTRPPAGAALARRRQRCDDAPLLTGCDPGPQFLHWMASPGHRSAGAAHALLNARLSALGPESLLKRGSNFQIGVRRSGPAGFRRAPHLTRAGGRESRTNCRRSQRAKRLRVSRMGESRRSRMPNAKPQGKGRRNGSPRSSTMSAYASRQCLEHPNISLQRRGF
jgi:hypothetical protein